MKKTVKQAPAKRMKSCALLAVVAFAGIALGAAMPRDIAPREAFKPGSVIVFVGDSITHGGRQGGSKGGMNHVYGHGYAAEIISRYLGYHPDMGLCFLNRGVSGDSTVTLLKRWDTDALAPVADARGWEGVFPGRTGPLKPDVLSLLVGVNDYMSGHAERRTTPEQYADNLETLVSRAEKALPECRIVLCGPFRHPVDSSPGFVARQNAARDVARRHGLCYVDFQKLFSEVLAKENPNTKYWMWDKCHPTYAAHIRMADWWLQTVMAYSRDRDGELLDLAAPVERWDDGIPLGNGGAGALLWGRGDTLNVTLDRSDYWHNVDMPNYLSPSFTWKSLMDVVATKDDEKRDRLFSRHGNASPTKLPGVRLVFKLGKGQTLKRLRLDGQTASASVTVATPSGDRDMLAWFDDGDSLLSLRVPDGVSFEEKRFVKNASFDELGGYPEPDIVMDEGVVVYRRRRREGANNRFDADFEAGVRFRNASARPDSAFWRKFNAESSVSIPDVEMQRLYDLSIYLYGAGARAGHPPLALQGLWTADNGKLPPWRGDYHSDLNTEMTYWAAGPAGHIEALEAFADFYIDRLPECRAFCRKLFDGGDGAVIPPTMGFAGQPIGGWTAYTVLPIHGIWAFDTMCDAWDYDPTPEKAAKFLSFGRELAAGIEHSWKVVNGVRKLDLSCSPEVGDNKNECFLDANSSYERAILESFYTWLSRLSEACGNMDEAARWRAYVGSFGPPNVTRDGVLEISAGNSLAFSHRHASHLMQVFPLVNVPPEPGVDFVKSVEHWEGLDDKPWWCGYSYSWAGCFEARLGRGDRAYRYLNDFQRAFVSRNGFHLNGDQLKCGLSRYTYRPFTLEGNFGYARGIQEMLLSYDPSSDTYRLFPALPKVWDGKEVSFCNLRLPGGHRVSAKRAEDGTITHALVPNPKAKTVPKLAASR